ncbi:hypothetical protein LO763_18720 [Glycomyces sp. A-F 0318]|nr:hypothetical protein [Glycomyces amatae]MCD0445643.1 hypothetical protein [Glycomyces amatae]
MKGLKRLRTALERTRIAVGCRELRRAREDLTVFRREGGPPPGPSFGSWL